MHRLSVLAAFLVLPLLAGCLADEGPDPAVRPHDLEGLAAFLADDVPAIEWDVADAVDWWEDLVGTGKRDAFLPDTPATQNEATRNTIAAALRDAGFEVQMRSWGVGFQGNEVPAGLADAYAVVATMPGTDAAFADHHVALIAHYDTQSATIEGAYDNGSGVAAVVHACIALAKVEMRRTLDCLLFDAEEEGTITSGRYVKEAVEAGMEYDMVLGFDMVGINWPGHSWKMYEFVGANVADWLVPFVETTARVVLEQPEDGVEVRDRNTRNSDEASFASAGYPTVRFAGGESAGDYPQYHMPDDTPAFIYDYVGGRANWEAGWGTVVESAYTMTLLFDATDLGELQGL